MMVKMPPMAGETARHPMAADAPHHVAAADAQTSGEDDHCLDHAGMAAAKSKSKSNSHAGHACFTCAGCVLWSVVPYTFPLHVHLDPPRADGPPGLMASFVSHIPESLQRPPAVAL